MKTIGITGIKGFIGSHLANELISRGYRVIGFDNLSHPSTNEVSKMVNAFYGDVRNVSDCERLAKNCDVIVHLAAEISVDKSIEDPELSIDVNIGGTKNILEVATTFDNKVIIAGSSEEYGTAQTEIQDESHPLDGQSPYAATKIAADRLGYAYYITYGIDVIIVRAFNVCGEGQGSDSYGGVIAIFADKINKDKQITINGTGEQTRDYTHVSDVVSAYIKLIEDSIPGEVYNVATGKDWSVKTIADMLYDISKKEKNIYYGPDRAGEVDKLKGDAAKLRKLGWYPKIEFKEALERIWRHHISL